MSSALRIMYSKPWAYQILAGQDDREWFISVTYGGIAMSSVIARLLLLTRPRVAPIVIVEC
jgi:hypothetical protein